jgi:hypothetical protein
MTEVTVLLLDENVLTGKRPVPRFHVTTASVEGRTVPQLAGMAEDFHRTDGGGGERSVLRMSVSAAAGRIWMGPSQHTVN